MGAELQKEAAAHGHLAKLATGAGSKLAMAVFFYDHLGPPVERLE